MKKKFTKVYQFKITLRDIKPSIWRRIQVPGTCTFWGLHVGIQDAMGWSDYHLHEFEMLDPSSELRVRIGIPDEDFGEDIIPGWDKKIASYFSLENPAANYTYDFGDNWEHIVQLEKILPREDSASYPRCIGGKRACPPEDCGGVPGYEDFLEIINDPEHEEHERMLQWVGGKFDSEDFEAKEVVFDDPEKRRREAFG